MWFVYEALIIALEERDEKRALRDINSYQEDMKFYFSL